ncbi:MAG: dihydropteroate synthase-like protein [Candidatus Bathyarchaeota archaeon]|nr:MAG: dihydropteroate synthase-like protein [Candidatus Bathyarchaeota archaeon]
MRTGLRVLIVTGKIAEESIRRKASGSKHAVDVRPLPVSVAAFITPDQAAEALGFLRRGDYELILLPGTVRGDVSPVEEATGIPTFKGPSNADDLPIVLDLLGEVEFSKTESASDLIQDARRDRAASELETVERSWRELVERHGGMVIGGEGRVVAVGSALPMRVIAEIVNAPTLDIESVRRRARYYESEGADIVDIGMLAGSPRPEAAAELVEVVRSSVELPVSIDTLDPSEIGAAADAGVDLVLSVDRGNMEEVAASASDTPVVVLPSNMREGILPRGAEERVAYLRENIERARDLGFSKIIADPVLEPAVKPGLLESLMAYRLFRRADSETPVLFGLGNVTELIDVDSPGVNGLLAALASEVGANLLFIPEYSPKARRSVRETAQAARMMFLAQRREVPPKDLGLDLLLLKEKRHAEEPYDPSAEEGERVLDARGEDALEYDRTGWFLIQVDRERGFVIATHFRGVEGPDVIVRGETAREIYQTIIREGLVGKYDHAAYLGKELMKAELALRLGRSYSQDGPLFK